MPSIAVRSLLLLITANSALAAGDPAAGAKKSALCQSCHGVNGMSQDTTIPHLAGQHVDYLMKQINDFQMQNRRDERMSPMADTVRSQRDLADIAAYFSSQKVMTGKPTKTAKAQLGKAIFERGIPTRGVPACAGCHGPNGKGSTSNTMFFPVIGGQHRQYILKQLNNFRLERRATDLSGTMTSIARELTPVEQEAVAEYASGL